jgi:ribosome-binding protein aMBF1 (putative translation factor)
MITCDLCGRAKDCLPKEIDGKEYDICAECWNPLAQMLKGKGRKIRETVFIPPPRATQEPEEEERPLPGEPPKIWGKRETLH